MKKSLGYKQAEGFLLFDFIIFAQILCEKSISIDIVYNNSYFKP